MTSRTLKKLCLTVSAAALVGFGAQSSIAQDEPLHPSLSVSLQQAVSTGISTNPEYGVVAASRRATDEELEQGEALFLPSVDVNADAGWEYSDDPATRAGDGSDDETLFRYETGVTLTQLLFDGWEAQYEVERQQARVVSSAHRVRETAELVGLAIVESYLEVLRQRELLVIARKNVADHISIMDQIERRVI